MGGNKDAVRHWLDNLGESGTTEQHDVPVICHDPSGTRVLASSDDERAVRRLMEPGMAGSVQREYSMLGEGDMVALLGRASHSSGGRTSHWVQLCRVHQARVCETWISGSVQDVDWGPLPDDSQRGPNIVEANKHVVRRWWDEMYCGQRFEELMAELAGPEYLRHEATGSWATTIQEHLHRVKGLYTGLEPKEPLRITYTLVAEHDRVAGWGTMRGYRGGATSEDSVNSFVQMFRLAQGRLVETWFAGWAVGVDWTI